MRRRGLSFGLGFLIPALLLATAVAAHATGPWVLVQMAQLAAPDLPVPSQPLIPDRTPDLCKHDGSGNCYRDKKAKRDWKTLNPRPNDCPDCELRHTGSPSDPAGLRWVASPRALDQLR